ncbi:phospholipase D/nuclease [Apiospora kogelbergensis]|uniref:Phospholipase D/nuclease n=1 Tax=Apiospora kogelbergensis TaxID=1337665 RepID=A0AAW0QHB2_9PEZI
MAYPNGALRITRTPGRLNNKNCVGLGGIINKEHLVSACIFAFYIADEEFLPYLPISTSSTDAVPVSYIFKATHIFNCSHYIQIYIGRDPNNDPFLQRAASRADIPLGEGKLAKKNLETLRPHLEDLHRTATPQQSSDESGGNTNIHAFYAWSAGCSHSKILLLVYPAFLRIVITSCNMMDIDTALGDNHWYLHDVPRRATRASRPLAGFEGTLMAHMEALGTPAAFLDSVRGVYLVTSHPGTFAGPKAEQHGLLRLRKIVKHLGLGLGDKSDDGKVRLEVCAASIGNISAQWLNAFYECALGEPEIGFPEDEGDGSGDLVPLIKLFFPTVSDVRAADTDSQEGASNIGCHLRPWATASQAVKEIFHHYRSKDAGRLFHQKLIMAYDPSQPDEVPHYIYVGSANLSRSAWGSVTEDKKRGSEATCHTKLTGVSNFECGVVIPGRLIMGLLEPGTGTWQDGVVPYDQTAEPYDLERDRPWSDPRWVRDYRDDYSD